MANVPKVSRFSKLRGFSLESPWSGLSAGTSGCRCNCPRKDRVEKRSVGTDRKAESDKERRLIKKVVSMESQKRAEL